MKRSKDFSPFLLLTATYAGPCNAYSRETTLAEVADTFRESIIDQHFDHYTEIIIGVREHAGAKNDNLCIRRPEVGINWTC